MKKTVMFTVLFLAATAYATEPRKVHGYFSAGTSIPASEMRHNWSLQIQGRTGIAFTLEPQLELIPTFELHYFKGKSRASDYYYDDTAYPNLSLMMAGEYLQYTLPLRYRGTTAYLLQGLGLAHLQADGGLDAMFFSVGIGIQISLEGETPIFLEARFVRIPVGNTGYSYFPLSLGIKL